VPGNANRYVNLLFRPVRKKRDLLREKAKKTAAFPRNIKGLRTKKEKGRKSIFREEGGKRKGKKETILGPADDSKSRNHTKHCRNFPKSN